MALTAIQTAILIVVSLMALELAKLATGYFFGKITQDDYVTTKALEEKCRECQKTSDRDRTTAEQQLDCLCRDMKEMKQILLLVALESKISPADLKTLVG